MTATAMTLHEPEMGAIERVLAAGDLSKLTTEQRVTYYHHVCESVGLNPLTRPLEFLSLNGKTVLYARKDCTEQLRSLRRVSLTLVSREQMGDLLVVTARATLPDGRQDESVGAVSTAGKRGDDLANAMMKAETKAKRRVTLSICGLGFTDESELETVPSAQPAPTLAAVTEPARLAPAPTTQQASPEAERAYQELARRLTLAGDEAGLKQAWAEVGHAAKGQRITLEMRAQLLALKDQRKGALKHPPAIPVAEALEGNEMPPGWGGEEAEKCCYCELPVGSDGVQFESPDGEVLTKHRNCTAFGKGVDS